MSKVKKCPKCRRKMVKGSEQTLGDVFGCTRRESEKPEDQRVTIIQPHYRKFVVTSNSTKNSDRADQVFNGP